jgi:ubiquinone/menaquinone biosynthesis C-methylase UbiE
MSRFLAAIYDSLMKKTEEACLRDWRAELLRDLRGRILEVGAGTGANLPHYSNSVENLVLCEPDPHMRKRLAARTKWEVIDASAEQLPFPDESFDTVVSTLVLCSVADPERALDEMRRVLRPGGRLVFLEHVVAEDNPTRLKWQNRINPLWMRLMDNCHLQRRTGDAINARFIVQEMKRESMRKAFPLVRPTIRGFAVR